MFHLRRFAVVSAFLLATVGMSQAQTALTIPKALQTEHHHVFEALEEATKASGKTGEAARRVMAVLKPHFEKEERFALPQLGALETLTKQGASASAELRKDLVARTEKFRTELPSMLEEHKKISAALRDMKAAAEQEMNDDVAEIAELIMGHAAMEEEVLYPASLLVGEYAKALESAKR